jgi:hypothetical protein
MPKSTFNVSRGQRRHKAEFGFSPDALESDLELTRILEV